MDHLNVLQIKKNKVLSLKGSQNGSSMTSPPIWNLYFWSCSGLISNLLSISLTSSWIRWDCNGIVLQPVVFVLRQAVMETRTPSHLFQQVQTLSSCCPAIVACFRWQKSVGWWMMRESDQLLSKERSGITAASCVYLDVGVSARVCVC